MRWGGQYTSGTVTPVCRRPNFGFQSPTCYWAKRFRAHKNGTGYIGVRCDNRLRVREINHPVNVPPYIMRTNLRPSRLCLPESLRARDRFFCRCRVRSPFFPLTVYTYAYIYIYIYEFLADVYLQCTITRVSVCVYV